MSAIALTTFLEAGAMGCIIGGSILCATGVGAGAGVPLIISGIALSIIGATPLLKFVKWDLQLNPQVAMIAAAIMQKIIIPIISVAMVITGIVFCATGPGVFIGCPLIAVGASLFVASFVFKEA